MGTTAPSSFDMPVLEIGLEDFQMSTSGVEENLSGVEENLSSLSV